MTGCLTCVTPCLTSEVYLTHPVRPKASNDSTYNHTSRMTVLTVRKMGNSLGFTVPSDESKRLGLHPGDQVDVHISKAGSMASIAGLLKGKLGDLDAFMHQMDLEEAGHEARRETQLDSIFDRNRQRKPTRRRGD